MQAERADDPDTALRADFAYQKLAADFRRSLPQPVSQANPGALLDEHIARLRKGRRRVSALPPDVLIRIAGEDQATRRAGPWPQAGSLADYSAATERALREAQRTQDIEHRWNMRFRLWEAPQRDDPVVADHTARLMARRRKAIDIAEDRQWLLRRILDPRGSA